MKKIIICSDGTWNTPLQTKNGKICPSNVYKILQCISGEDEKKNRQIKFYDAGIGAESDKLGRLIRGLTGKGLSANIEDCYRFIMNNYEIGDELYFFGFSRGAYTVRSTVGLIRKCGILKRQNSNMYKIAYDFYRNDIKPDKPEAKEFRSKYSYETNIEFIGVWDTVGRLGIPLPFKWMTKLLKNGFHDTTLSSTVNNAFQALAIDEKRKPFKPTLWDLQPSIEGQTVEQLWFPGVHTDIGGGGGKNGLSDITLGWMIAKAKLCKLSFDEEILNSFGYSPELLENVDTNVCIAYYLFMVKKRDICESLRQGVKVSNEAYSKYVEDKEYKPVNLIEYLEKYKFVN